MNLPKISVITPSFNQAQFLEKTITSVLSQNYPNLEYIIMDGGSTDETLDILKRYTGKIKWILEKDRGQSHAINKGLKMATGDIHCFINSDDYFKEGTLLKVGKYFAQKKDAFWLTGKCMIVNEKGKEVRKIITLYKNIFLKYYRFKELLLIINYISQPSTFWRKEVTEKIGLMDEKLQYSMDYDYWLRIGQKYRLDFLDEYLASYRIHSKSKAVISPETQFQVEYDIIKRYTRSLPILLFHKIHASLSLLIYRLFFIKK